jgi:hypothetical protein
MRVKAKTTEPDGRRGFNGNGATVSLVLVEGDVDRAAAAVKTCAKCTTWRKDVYGERARATKQSYIVYRLVGHGWSMVQSVSGKPVPFDLAMDLSRELGGRTMWLSVSDVASWTGYYRFDAGVMTELLEDYGEHHGDASHLPRDAVGALEVRPTGRGIFGSSVRKVAASKLKTPLDVETFVDAMLRAENVLAPVSGEWGGEGGTVTLDLPNLEDDVERLDLLAGGQVPPPTAGERHAEAELKRFRRGLGKRKAAPPHREKTEDARRPR